MWAALYAVSYLCLPVILLGGAFPAAVAVVIGASWLRFVHAIITTPPVRRLGPLRLAIASVGGPEGALWVRRRVGLLLPPMTLRPGSPL